jgi:hypothetical protein
VRPCAVLAAVTRCRHWRVSLQKGGEFDSASATAIASTVRMMLEVCRLCDGVMQRRYALTVCFPVGFFCVRA